MIFILTSPSLKVEAGGFLLIKEYTDEFSLH